jgi:prepilin-type N-terminal cleavage/methylation domain-containing protein
MKINTSRKAGFTLVEIMIVVAIIGLLAAIAIPNFVRARTTSQMNACINNLRQIDGAKQQWALETKQPASATPVESNVAAYLGRAASTAGVVCPSGGATADFDDSYVIGALTAAPTCRIVGGTTAGTSHFLP